jgi:hypothetical protein
MNTVEDLIFTLELCKRLLPGDVHPVHFERLAEIERLVKRLKEDGPDEPPREGEREREQEP